MGPMIYNPTALVLLAVAYILALLVVLRWPSVGVALVLAVPVTKSLIQMRVGPILQDYTFDVGVAILAIVGALIHRLRSVPRTTRRCPCSSSSHGSSSQR